MRTLGKAVCAIGLVGALIASCGTDTETAGEQVVTEGAAAALQDLRIRLVSTDWVVSGDEVDGSAVRVGFSSAVETADIMIVQADGRGGSQYLEWDDAGAVRTAGNDAVEDVTLSGDADAADGAPAASALVDQMLVAVGTRLVFASVDDSELVAVRTEEWELELVPVAIDGGRPVQPVTTTIAEG